jgi:hypothetical protein
MYDICVILELLQYTIDLEFCSSYTRMPSSKPPYSTANLIFTINP